MPSATFFGLLAFLSVLWLAGGASRPDALGQAVVRGCAWTLMVATVLFGRRRSFQDTRPVLIVALAALALAVLALVPVPPTLWTGLPGRAPFIEASAASGQAQPWRPWSIVPGATANAAFSLIVPLTAIVLLSGLRDGERRLLPGVLLAFVAASALLGLTQFSGLAVGNPLINDTAGQISGSFANRNHFALFLAFGCLLAPTWAFGEARGPGWRGPVAVGLMLLFTLMILASGSRAGLILGVAAIGVGIVLVGQHLRTRLRRAPRWVWPAMTAAILGVILGAVWVSVAADRAASIDRVFAIDPGQDVRRRALPTVIAMIGTYWPVGSGLGSFDPMFRLHEPATLLKTTYFNHAHNDFLEIVLDAGLPGMLVVMAALGWWAWASVRVWRGVPADERSGSGRDVVLARIGSTILFLIMIASLVDYPARTPMMMAVTVIAGVWLGGGTRRDQRPALPRLDVDL